MSGIVEGLKATLAVSQRELKRIFTTPLLVFSTMVGPVFCFVFFLTLMGKGLPNNIPVAVVDLDRSYNSRALIRSLKAFQNTHVSYYCANFSEARDLMQRGKIYGAFYIPEDFSKDLQAQRQPTISFYCNYAYYSVASLVFQDFKMMSELAVGAATRSSLRSRGAGRQTEKAFLQPVTVERHLLENPWTNYSVYLNNLLLPAVLLIFVFLTTVYTIGVELKRRTAHQWISLARGSIFSAVVGKILPQSLIFCLMGMFYNFLMYGVLGFPCLCGIPTMLMVTSLLILAAQGFGIFLIGLIPHLRFAMALASLWSIVGISMSGFTFPITSMPPVLKALSLCFPIRHYFLIYVCEALNGYSLYYCLHHILWLLLFMMLPLTVLYRLKGVLLTYRYEP